MPTYEYECSSCGHSFEKFESMRAKPSKGCPACRKRTAVRKISGGAGLLFKGSGFYCTDYSKKPQPEAPKPPEKKKEPNGQ